MKVPGRIATRKVVTKKTTNRKFTPVTAPKARTATKKVTAKVAKPAPAKRTVGKSKTVKAVKSAVKSTNRKVTGKKVATKRVAAKRGENVDPRAAKAWADIKAIEFEEGATCRVLAEQVLGLSHKTVYGWDQVPEAHVPAVAEAIGWSQKKVRPDL